MSLKELTEVMKNMDSNMNGTISFDEFVRGMYEFVVKHKTAVERRLVEEWWSIIQTLGHTLTDILSA